MTPALGINIEGGDGLIPGRTRTTDSETSSTTSYSDAEFDFQTRALMALSLPEPAHLLTKRTRAAN
ncbi:hypothetical protein [Nocardia nepalensis]|uniref:hypothetical protein n=1 Tax=Nocardia nepalensis TaxID=3375448 RepID=UPI003B67EB22